MVYAGFWRRFGAYWIDVLCMTVPTSVTWWLNEQTRFAMLIWFLPGVLIGIWFHVYLVKRYGGTPGKLVLGMRIVKVDGTPAGYREAFLRYSPLLILAAMVSVAFIIASFRITEAEYRALAWMPRFQRLSELTPAWYKPVLIVENIWVWSEFIVMMTNKKRRALHDFLAGNVVILKDGAQQAVPADLPPKAAAGG